MPAAGASLILGEIFDAAADVARPLVLHSLGAGVDRHERQFVEPSGDIAILVDIADRLTRAHRDAEHIVFVQAHSARQRGDVAIVADSHRHVADLLGCADIDVFDLGIKQVLGHLEEKGCVHCAVVDIDARRRDTDRIHPRHMLRCRLHRRDDPLEMVVGVRIGLGEPDDFLAEYRLSVDDRRNLAVAAARVKPDPAALQMPSDRLGFALLLRRLTAGHHLKRAFIDVRHEIRIKCAAAAGRIRLLHLLADAVVPTDVDFEAALHPQDGLYSSGRLRPSPGSRG